jgi:hypothetical protein
LGYDPKCETCHGTGRLVRVCAKCKGERSFNVYSLPIRENAFKSGATAYGIELQPYKKVRTGAETEKVIAQLRAVAPANTERPLVFEEDHFTWSDYVSICYDIYRIGSDGFVIQRTNPGSGGEGDVGEY